MLYTVPGGAWTTLAQTHERSSGRAFARVTFGHSGTYSVRIVLARTHRGRAVYGPVRSLKVIPSHAPEVLAHRGGSLLAPENTISAFTRAIADGARSLETDVQETSDGQLVLFHDATPARTTDVAERFPGRENDLIGTFTLAELLTLDAGFRLGPEWAGTSVATLDELLSLVSTSGVSLLAEAKNPANSPGIAQKLLDRVAAAGLHSTGADNRIVFESFDLGTLQNIRSLDPNANVSPILSSFPAHIGDLSWANSITLRSSAATAIRMAAAHLAGLEVNVWTPNTAKEFDQLADEGVDGIITDDPKLALATLH
ncbi:MAG: glycerophosphodiester phosphodiesterase family protein [Marmoricola sp.]